MPNQSIPDPRRVARHHQISNARSGRRPFNHGLVAAAICLGLLCMVAFGSALVACSSNQNSILSAEAIQATVNAIVTASASPPSQANSPAPFQITSLSGSGWTSEVVRILPTLGSIEEAYWSESSNLVIHSSAGTYALNPSMWGQWADAWSEDSSHNQTLIPSPDGSHHILIENHMWIIRRFDGNPIGLIGDVPESVRWTSDGSAVMFAITNQEAELQPGLYVWPVNSHSPRLVLAEHANLGKVYISPSGTRAAYLVMAGASTDLSLRLVDLPSGDAETRRLDLPQGWQLADWVSDDLLRLSVGLTSPSFTWYNVVTQALYPVQDGQAEISPAPPLPSPDGRWVAGDSIQLITNQTGELTTNQMEHIYFVTNVTTDNNHDIAYGNDSAIEYLTWSPDSQKLFLVSCPTHENAQASASAPYGLLAYAPESNTSEVLFGKALQVALNPSQQWAYVVFPSINSNDERVLSGALWEVGSQALLHRRVLLEDFVYRNPNASDNHQPVSYFYARWSHDGQRLAVVDPGGSLRLYDLAGQVDLLQDDLFAGEADWIHAMNDLYAGGLFWSPDDHFLLLNYHGLYLMRLD